MLAPTTKRDKDLIRKRPPTRRFWPIKVSAERVLVMFPVCNAMISGKRKNRIQVTSLENC